MKHIGAFALAISGILSLISPGANASEEKVLHVYNWSDYIAPYTIQNFEQETASGLPMSSMTATRSSTRR